MILVSATWQLYGVPKEFFTNLTFLFPKRKYFNRITYNLLFCLILFQFHPTKLLIYMNSMFKIIVLRSNSSFLTRSIKYQSLRIPPSTLIYICIGTVN